MNVVIEHKEVDGYREAYYVLLTINVIFAAYFLLNEVR